MVRKVPTLSPKTFPGVITTKRIEGLSFKFEFGDFIEERFSGLQGHIIAMNDYLTGCNAYCIRCKAKSSNEESSSSNHWIEENDVILLERNLRYVPDFDIKPFALGWFLEDRMTGYGGYASTRTFYLSGAIHYGLQNHELTKENKIPEWEFFSHPRLKVIKKGGKEFRKPEKPEPLSSPNLPNPIQRR